MTIPLVQSLIDKQGTLRAVRDQVAAIILGNSANQQALAESAGKDPKPWKLRVFVDRTDCSGEYTSNDDDEDAPQRDPTPIVNVQFDETEYDKKRGTPTQHQQADATFCIDIYGCGVATDTTDGHAPGDAAAADEALRAYMLVFNFLMSDVCSNLGLPGIVGDHWPEKFKLLAVPPGDRDKPRVERVAVGRLELSVSFVEFAPQYEAPLLETVTGTVKRKETGELYLTTKPPLGV